MITAGIDIGTGAVKAVLFDCTTAQPRWLSKMTYRIRQKDPFEVATDAFNATLEDARLTKEQVRYVATTGEGENLAFRTGHFYSMTTHARGAVFLMPEARGVMDVGALHGRAIRIDSRGKVLSYKMTSQCASGSGQFLENIARYLGVSQDEIGTLSREGATPEKVSSICAVLAETDVINMVSRGIAPSNILRGIHQSMASRMAKLVKSLGALDGPVALTGGLAGDAGMVHALNEAMNQEKMGHGVLAHQDSIYGGAVGAALWGAFRAHKLALLESAATAA